MEIRILYEDRDLIVCEKPAAADSEGAGPMSMVTLLSALLRERGERSDIYPIHRLDRGVRGVMVYAKNRPAAARLSRALADGLFQKRYLAVCQKDAASSLGERGELTDLLFRDREKNKSYVVDRPRRGVKEARLAFRVLGVVALREGTASLVEIRLFTGRTHQIRVQFSSRGHALLGDRKYGGPPLASPALFSYSLAFPHPENGRTLRFSLPVPDENPWTAFPEALAAFGEFGFPGAEIGGKKE